MPARTKPDAQQDSENQMEYVRDANNSDVVHCYAPSRCAFAVGATLGTWAASSIRLAGLQVEDEPRPADQFAAWDAGPRGMDGEV